MQSFAKNLKEIREDAKLTQEQLAQAINVSRQAISAWERGRTEPDIAAIIALGEALNVSSEELLFGKKTARYERFQKKYLICAIVSLAFALLILILHSSLALYLEVRVNASYVGVEAYLFVFELLTPFLGWTSLGVGAASTVALFYKIGLRGRCRRATFFAGLLTALPSVLVILDFLLSMLIPAYKAPFTFLLFVSTVRSPTVQMLLFALLPVVSGILLFSSLNKKPISLT